MSGLVMQRQASSAASRASSVAAAPRPTLSLNVSKRAPLQQRQHHRGVALRAEPDTKNGVADSNQPLKRESEPDEYWSPPSERKGANPMKDPIAIIGVIAILFPFLILGLAIATGVIDTSVYQG